MSVIPSYYLEDWLSTGNTRSASICLDRPNFLKEKDSTGRPQRLRAKAGPNLVRASHLDLLQKRYLSRPAPAMMMMIVVP